MEIKENAMDAKFVKNMIQKNKAANDNLHISGIAGAIYAAKNTN